MKYIRTKDGIYEVEEWFKPLENDMVYIPNEGLNKILNQADTIEELCDEFVIKGTRGLYLGVPLSECELRGIPTTQIYGAIWTEKGLIYVAKMNEKGELCLL